MNDRDLMSRALDVLDDMSGPACDDNYLRVVQDLRAALAKPEKRKRTAAPSIPAPDGVDVGVWGDWLKLRSAKKAPVTETVVRIASREASKAGMPLERFLEIWCLRGSQGLEAAWLTPDERTVRPQKSAYLREKEAQASAWMGTPPPWVDGNTIEAEAPNVSRKTLG